MAAWKKSPAPVGWKVFWWQLAMAGLCGVVMKTLLSAVNVELYHESPEFRVWPRSHSHRESISSSSSSCLAHRALGSCSCFALFLRTTRITRTTKKSGVLASLFGPFWLVYWGHSGWFVGGIFGWFIVVVVACFFLRLTYRREIFIFIC